jgi:hypothetical protein
MISQKHRYIIYYYDLLLRIGLLILILYIVRYILIDLIINCYTEVSTDL